MYKFKTVFSNKKENVRLAKDFVISSVSNFLFDIQLIEDI